MQRFDIRRVVTILTKVLPGRICPYAAFKIHQLEDFTEFEQRTTYFNGSKLRASRFDFQ